VGLIPRVIYVIIEQAPICLLACGRLYKYS